MPSKGIIVSDISILALIGSSASGKSTVAQRLVERHGYTRVRFAQPLKDMLICLGLTPEHVDGPQCVRERPIDLLCGKSPRYAMQTLGTEWRDMIDRRLWAKVTRKRISDLLVEGITKFVIDDMRFPHEAEMFREIGCVIVAIRRPELEPTRVQRIWSSLPVGSTARGLARIAFRLRSFHKSETEWFKIKPDTTVMNTKTLDDLYHSIDGIAS